MKTNARSALARLALVAGLFAVAACGDEDGAPLPEPVFDPVISTFTASRASVRPGQSVDLTYRVATSTSVTLTREGTSGTEVLVPEARVSHGVVSSGPLDEDTTFRLVAKGNHARVERTLTVAVSAPEVEIIRFSATPSLAPQGSDVEVSWSVRGATRLRLLDEGRVVVDRTPDAADGTFSLHVLRGPRHLLLEASNPWRTRTARVEVATRDPGEIMTFDLSPSVFEAPTSPVTLRWEARGERVDLWANGAPFRRGLARTGSISVSVAEPTIFELSAAGLGHTARARRAVAPGALRESEPNDDPAGAGPVAAGVLGKVGEEGDFFALDVPPGGHVFAELSDGLGRCDFDGGLRLLDAQGVELLEVDNGERGPCARLDPLEDPRLVDLAAGRYYLAVDGLDHGAAYGLALFARPGGCGDGLLEPSLGEECDDGNRSSLDGCSATCRMELSGTIELPGAPRVFSLSLGAAAAHYAIDLSRPVVLAVETGVPAIGACDGAADTALLLYDAELREIAWADDADGVRCARLLPVVPAPLAAGRYYLRVAPGGEGMVSALEVRVWELEARCGDGVLADTEGCDDGNTTDGDGCSASCVPEPIQAPGGSLELVLGAGATREVEVEITRPGQSITATTSDGHDGCTVDTRLILMKGTTYLGYDTSGAGCAAFSGRTHAFARDLDVGTYRVLVHVEGRTGGDVRLDVGIEEPRCGNQIRETHGGEQCDDGNSVDGDGCSAACLREVSATAHGPGGPAETFSGALPLAGDDQLFAIDLAAPGNILVELGVPTMGACGADTVAELYDSSLNLVTQNDDWAGQLCSRIDPAADPAARVGAGRYILRIRAFYGQVAIPAYEVRITLTAAGCGNGVLEGGEECDDGNLVGGDGCSDTCAFDGTLVRESEPNDSRQTANVSTATVGAAALLTGAISPGDLDLFTFEIPAGSQASLKAATRTDLLNAQVCANADTFLTLYDATGAMIVLDDDNGPETCSLIDGTGPMPPNPEVRALPGGTYYLEVRAFSAEQAIPIYFVALELRP